MDKIDIDRSDERKRDIEIDMLGRSRIKGGTNQSICRPYLSLRRNLHRFWQRTVITPTSGIWINDQIALDREGWLEVWRSLGGRSCCR
jgi:hypothetical protein